MKFSLEKFSTPYREILANSVNLALSLNYSEIAPEILFVCLLEQEGAIGRQILTRNGIDAQKIKKTLKKKKNNNLQTPTFSSETIKLIDRSATLALEKDTPYIGTEHLLLALLKSNNSTLNKFFQEAQINYLSLETELETILNNTLDLSEIGEFLDSNAEMEILELPEVEEKPEQSFLELFTQELTDPKTSPLDPVTGRDLEIERLCQILLRRTKNNPLLLGEPGVGKTAVVEGLAKMIQMGQAPSHLQNKKIYLLDLSSLVAGTMYRGEFESRMKELLKELKKQPEAIIFIDEIHNIVGAGSTQGSMDVANLIKPALARGEIRCIGATTYKEYKKFIAHDSALDRRFQPININEPTPEQTLQILKTLKKNYQDYHGLKISQEALLSAIHFSQLFMTQRHFPDKAIDLLDEACSKVKLKQKQSCLEIKLAKINQMVNLYENLKTEEIAQENYTKANNYTQQIKKLLKEKRVVLNKLATQNKQSKKIVGKKDIASVIAYRTGLPIAKLLKPEKTKLLNLEKTLSQKIIGQKKAIKQLTQVVKKAQLGLRDYNKPLASFIFIGPSGVGKTHTAKVLATEVFHSEQALIKIDMSEFSESHSISKLIGAPAGYVGYREDSKLIAQIKKKPTSVVLFDEIEKAHPEILNILLQILDDGYLTDSTGEKVSFTNSLIIMTSNLGSNKANKLLGFTKTEQKTEQKNDIFRYELEKFLRPEVLNRINQVLVFEELTQEHLIEITKTELKLLQSRLKHQKIQLRVEPQVLKYLASLANQSLGARAIPQIIQEHLENHLINKILKSKQNNFQIKLQDNRIKIL